MNLGDNQSAHRASTSMRRSTPFKPIRLLLGFACAGVVFALFVWGSRIMHEVWRRDMTRSRFAQIAMALSNYSDVFGQIPFAARYAAPGDGPGTRSSNGPGNPLYSWRVELVPFLMSWRGSWDRTQPWHHASNRSLVDFTSFYTYDWTEASRSVDSVFPDTIVLAVTGPGTVFGDGTDRPRSLTAVPPETIIIVESGASGVPWPAPGDLDICTMSRVTDSLQARGISSLHRGGFHVVFADGEVWFLSNSIPFETLAAFFTIEEAARHNRDELLGMYVLQK
jgi:hypothetical protein